LRHHRGRLRGVLVGRDVANLSNGDPFPEPARAESRDLCGYVDPADTPALAPPDPRAGRARELWSRQRAEASAHRLFTYDPESGDQVFCGNDLHHTREKTFMSRDPDAYRRVIAVQLANFTDVSEVRWRYFARAAELCRASQIP